MAEGQREERGGMRVDEDIQSKKHRLIETNVGEKV